MVGESGKVYRTVDSGSTWSAFNIKDNLPDPCPLPGHNLELWRLAFENPLSSTSAGWVVGGTGFNNGYICRTTGGGAAGTWSQTKCYDFLVPGDQDSPICGLSTLYAVAVLGGTDPQVITGGYGRGVFDYRAGSADFDPCACTPTPPGDCTAGGPTWVQLAVPDAGDCSEKPPIFGVCRISAIAACVVGSFNRILLYVNGILTDKATTVFSRLGDGAFTSATTGVVAGQGWTIKRTTDAGLTWNDVDIDWICSQSGFGQGIAMSANGTKGVMVGSAGFIAYGTASGQTWHRVLPSPVSADINAVEFTQVTTGGCAAQERAYAVSSSGRVIVSDDFGQSWTLLTDPNPGENQPLWGVSFATSCVGYVCGDGAQVFRTIDGGQTWDPVPVVGNNPGDQFCDVATWGDGTQAVLVGQNGGVYEKLGTRFQKQALQTCPPPGSTLGVTATLRDVEVLNSGTNLRICGDDGVVLFRDAGCWTRVRSQTTMPLHKLEFQSPTHGFGVGRNFMITEYRP